MINYNLLRRKGVVSIWIGNFTSDVELDNYLNLSHDFERDFGFKLNEKDTPEVVVESQPIPIKELVDGFSWSNSYSSEVVNAAKIRNIDKATTMLVFLNFAYKLDEITLNKNTPLQFLGVFSFS